jgi:hypothetical protein
MMNSSIVLSAGFLGLALLGCKPDGSPPEMIRTQRDAMNEAKALEGKMQQQAHEQMKAADDTGK